MPKPNQTMLDKLAETFKSMGKKKPEIIQQTTIRDPLSYPLKQRHPFGRKPGEFQIMDITPEREIYQQGLKNQFWKKEGNLRREQDEAMDRVDELQQSYESDFNDARDRLAEDVSSEITGWDPEEIQAYEAGDYKSPSYRIENYWEGEYNLPEYEDLMSEADDAFNEAAGRLIDWQNSGMRDLQLRSPRYRNYQRAMRQRQDNARVGRLNAAIMNLYRRGYSMPEIREILRNQRMR